MAHVRKSIRDDIVTNLTGLTTTGSNVFESRIYPAHVSKLPALFIYVKSESSQPSTMGTRRYERTVTFSVEALVYATSGYDNTLDTIAKEVEVALQADVERSNNATDTRVVGYETDYSDQGDKPIARGVIDIEVDYETLEGDPETAV